MNRLWIAAVWLLVGGTASLQAVAQKKELVVATSQSDAGKLDPHQASAGADKGVLNWMFNGAGAHPARDSRARNSSSPTWPKAGPRNAQGTEWTFKIRDSVAVPSRLRRFTAEDAAYSLQARRRQGALGIRGRFRRDREGRGHRRQHARRSRCKNPIPSLLGLAVELSRRPDGVPQGGRGDGRRTSARSRSAPARSCSPSTSRSSS